MDLSQTTNIDNTKELGQYFTPAWAAQKIFEMFFGHLPRNAYVIEPSCGDGRFLQVMPETMKVIGVEIDPFMADRARMRTGRPVITADFREADLEGNADAIIGNPPYEMKVVDGMLERAKQLLAPHGELGFILPAYAFQTPSRVVRYSRDWMLEPTMLPRTLFPGLSKPLMWAMFRQQGPQWAGMALYEEAVDVEGMPKAYSDILKRSAGSVWKKAVAHALYALGGEASLEELYSEIEPKRPTGNKWWKEQIRKVARECFDCLGGGRYAFPQAA